MNYLNWFEECNCNQTIIQLLIFNHKLKNKLYCIKQSFLYNLVTSEVFQQCLDKPAFN